MKVEQIEIAPGLKIPRVITGLWQIADMERDGKSLDLDKTARAMTEYTKAGLSVFDMADHYGSAEIISGIFYKKYANGTPVQFLTKWVPAPGTVAKEDVRKAVQRALDRLQVERIDLMQFHAWSYADPRWLDCLHWLKELQDEGLIFHLGLTNFDSAHLNIIVNSGIRIATNQVSYSLLDQRAATAMTQLCLQHNIKILAFGTIAGGFLTNKWLGHPEPEMTKHFTWSEMKYKRFIDASGGWQVFQQLLDVLETIARKFDVSLSNVASRYLLEQPAVGGVLIGARLGASEHVSENLKLSDFALDHISKSKIQKALSLLTAIPGDCGDEYRKPPFLTASGDLSHHVMNFPPPYSTKEGSCGRIKVLSGTVWEDIAGFSRGIRKGDAILISGTTATHGSTAIGGHDPAAQVHFVIDKIEGAIQSLGGKLEDVVRTRVFIRNISDWEVIARAHGERFKDIQPANTMVRADLIGDDYLVEMEAEAILSKAAG